MCGLTSEIDHRIRARGCFFSAEIHRLHDISSVAIARRDRELILTFLVGLSAVTSWFRYIVIIACQVCAFSFLGLFRDRFWTKLIG